MLVACLLWHYPVVINEDGCPTCRIWSEPRCIDADAVSHTTAGFILITSLSPPSVAENTTCLIAIHHYWTRFWLGRYRQHEITELVQFVFFMDRSDSGKEDHILISEIVKGLWFKATGENFFKPNIEKYYQEIIYHVNWETLHGKTN